MSKLNTFLLKSLFPAYCTAIITLHQVIEERRGMFYRPTGNVLSKLQDHTMRVNIKLCLIGLLVAVMYVAAEPEPESGQ
ncbi:hypothetical protein CEXT_26051 [Caerostris extrusa]|uniref:Uncharacterized protein n=1 Tax=Caerostris extrusa TaxID=172846 RepID=A0AAV4YD76_CAEEX|nr:hypothetical protein CEXT_26051 [Caerostris extrusa]